MNKLKYLFMATVLGFAFTACDDDDDNYGVLDGIGMITRSVSLEDGATVRANTLDRVTVKYNNLIAVNPAVEITLNSTPVAATVNPDNGMELIIPVELEAYTDYVLTVPQGAVYRKDDATVVCDAVTVNFNTKTGINYSLLATAPVNAAASPEAKNVYKFLLENYGNKQLSGAMADIAWGNGFTDVIFQETGKYPAIAGFDYIHLASSSPSGWINYGDITSVQTAWDNNSIPAISWHWNVPKNRPGSVSVWTGESVMPSDWSGNLQLTDDASKEKFAKASAGATLTVKTKDRAAGAQGSLKNSGWGALADGLDYFNNDWDGAHPDCIEWGEDYFTLTLDQAMADEIKANGVIISGHDYTVTEVLLTIPAGGDLGFDASSETFKASEVLVPGSWENQVATADVEKLAGYLKLLRDANIPVLWRPFHEAAGDYTWGAWFWWGNCGTEVTKDLWKWLYEELTVKHGLNNLIWVWTMQTSDEGKPADVAKLIEAYPGDEYVDIVGADLYEDALTNHTVKFDLLYKAVAGKKMVALAECGNLLDVDSAYNDGALWSFFMGWYESKDGNFGIYDWNTNGEWKTVMENPLVINRDKMPSLK